MSADVAAKHGDNDQNQEKRGRHDKNIDKFQDHFVDCAAELGRNSQLRTGLILLTILLIGAIGAPVFATHDPFKLYDSIRVAPGVDGFLFGTDNLGRDIFSQILYGARTSLQIGIIAATISA